MKWRAATWAPCALACLTPFARFAARAVGQRLQIARQSFPYTAQG